MKKELYDLTNPQKSIWITEQYYKGTSIGNIVGTLCIDEPVNFTLLKDAINIFIENNDGMRLKFILDNEFPKQYVSPYIKKDFIIHDLKDINSLNSLESLVTNSCFNIIDSELYEFHIFKLPNNHGGFIAKMHHLISDAWTMSVLTNQIMDNYSKLISNTKIENKLCSYIDFITSEQNYMQSSKFLKSKEFWESEFTSLSYSYISDLTSTSCTAKRKTYSLDKNYCNKLKNFCKNNKCSVYNIFMSALSIYLSKINNVNNPIIGTPVLNRSNFQEKNTIGMFISTIPFKTHIEPTDTYISFLKELSNIEFSMFRNQKYPYNILLEDLRKKFNISQNLYDIALSYQNAKNNSVNSDIKYHTSWIFNNTVSNNMDIHIYDTDDTGLLQISYDYKTDLFNDIDIELLHERILKIINQLLNNSEIIIKDINILCDKELNYIYQNYDNCKKENKTYLPVIKMFENQAKSNPNNICVSDYNKSYTYKEINNLANNLANILINEGVRNSDIISLFFENSIELIVSILATLKIGACYIPIDIKYPIDRIKYILENSNSKIILSNQKNISNLDSIDIQKICVNVDELKSINSNFINEYEINSSDLAYIIYTSGSTGKPKGVKITNKSLSNYINFCIEKYVGNEFTNFPLYSSIAFDLTVTSLFTPLSSGNSIYIYNNDNPELLLKSIIEDEKVQIIKLTPAHLSLLLEIDCSKSVISKFIVGGDSLPIEICEQLSSAFSHDIYIYNEYGPTETTVGCMIYEYNSKDNKYSSVPIGKPIDNVKIFLLDKSLSFVPCGNIGEIYIGGDCLSSGYIGLDEVNKNSFIKSPFNSNELLYKTGDLAKLYYNDTMEYFGRTDFQIKINGYRIEIGEIQSNLLKHGKIKDCYVTTINMDNKKILCAYYTSLNDENLNDLDSFLSKNLPIYMIPKYFVKLESIPLTVNGKVDKKALPMPTIKEEKYISPKNSLEELIQGIFEKLLDLQSHISVTTNIFNYYIDSLILIKAQTMLYSNGIDINTQVFYEYKTIRDLADYILNHTASDYYNEDIYPTISNISIPINKKFDFNNILLFGSTGFLGIHILHTLLETTQSQIYCLIREKNNISPYERLKNKFEFYYSYDEFIKYQNRIHIIEGNILQNDFNLNIETYQTLCNYINCVIDTAAIVKHYGSYDEFLKTNVNGTKEIVKFCKTSNSPLHYISTLSISGYGLVEVPKNASFNEESLFIGQKYKDNVYVRSKFEAENYIINECKNGLIASIYRIGNITNRYTDGNFQENANENAFLNRLLGFISLGCIPNDLLSFNFEFTPIDICANFIVQLLNNQDKNLKIYHLFNQNYITGEDLVKYINNNNFNITSVDNLTFKEKLLSSNELFFGITNYINNLNNNTVLIDNSLTNSYLKKYNLSWPKIDNEYISKIIKYLENNNFIGDVNNEKK